MRSKHWYLIITVLALMIAFTGVAQAKDWTLRLASSKEGTATYSSAVGMSAAINKHLAGKGIKMEATPTPGSTGSVKMLPRGGVDLVFTSTWVLRDSYNNTGPFKKSPVNKKALQGWYFATVNWIPTTKKSNDDVNTLADLKGKKFFPYEGGSGVFAVYKYILEKLGYWKDIDIRQLSGMEAADALKMGIIDAVGTYASASGYAAAGWVKNLDATVDLKVLNPSDKEKSLIGKIPGISAGLLPNNWLSPKNQKNNPQKLWGWSMHYGMHPGSHVPTDVMYQIYKIWIEKAQSDLAGVSAMMKAYAEMDPLKIQVRGIEEGKDIPVHPGVAKYLKEKGLWQDHWKIGKLDQGVK